ncbi:MAG: carbohydrate kinase family protein [Limisphaerales bacterium]
MEQTILSYGEVLWDLLPAGPMLGGAPFNFAARMAAFGHPCVMVSRIGQDALGKQAMAAIRDHAVETCCVQVDPKLPTGTVTIELDDLANAHYHITEQVAYDHLQFDPVIRQVADHARVLYFGTLVQRSKQPRQTLAELRRCLPQDALCICDLNLRQACYSLETVQASLGIAHWLKCNQEEILWLSEALGWSHQSLLGLIERTMDQWQLEGILLTLGKQGALVAAASGEMCYQPGFQVKVRETIGAGDATTAAFVHHRLKGDSLETCILRGCALGSLVATRAGGTCPVTNEELDHFLANPPAPHIDSDLKSLWKGY